MATEETLGISARIARLKEAIRAEPAEASHRIALFQLYCIQGEWESAATQLQVAQGIDTQQILFTQVYGKAITCEAQRAKVLQGEATPIVIGEPEEWVGLLIRSLQLASTGKWGEAAEVQASGFDAAPECKGIIDGQEFAWLADCDSRFGPILEAFVDGDYRWIPFSRISEITFNRAEHLIDAVWTTARIMWHNAGATSILIPTRYAGSEKSSDDQVRLAQKTNWEQKDENYYIGEGQRILASDAAEYSLLQTRQIMFS